MLTFLGIVGGIVLIGIFIVGVVASAILMSMVTEELLDF